MDHTDMFEAERPRLVVIASRVLSDHAEAQDVVQQAWLRLNATDAEIDSLPAWLTTVTTRLCLDRLRSRTPVPVGDVELMVIGAGWIGSEVAASARQLGAEVAIVAPEAVPLVRVLGPEVGGVYRDLHAGHGVDLHLSTQIEAIVGNGAARGVRTTDGVVIEGDLVIVGVGVSPRVELARDAGLTLENDILVDEFLAFWLKDGRVLAGMNANIWDQGDDIKALIRSGASVDPDRLADPSVPLADQLSGSST